MRAYTSKWYVIALLNDGLGCVLAYSEFDSEQEANAFGRAGKGEMADRFNLYINQVISEKFEIEIISAVDFVTEYRGRMPLCNLVQA
jgi:hypothetical protein